MHAGRSEPSLNHESGQREKGTVSWIYPQDCQQRVQGCVGGEKDQGGKGENIRPEEVEQASEPDVYDAGSDHEPKRERVVASIEELGLKTSIHERAILGELVVNRCSYGQGPDMGDNILGTPYGAVADGKHDRVEGKVDIPGPVGQAGG
jgi:hypothetical protein